MPESERPETEDWKEIWDARLAALKRVLGRPTDKVYHATLPMYLGGFADVLPFPDFVSGMTYVTADLTGENVGQLPSSLGNYELMVCVREELPKAADMISRLARYTTEASLEPGSTMDLPDFFRGSVIKALFFTHPREYPVQFEFLGQQYGLLLCIGITSEELAFKHANGSGKLLSSLWHSGVFPYTVLQRKSVVT